MPKNRLQNMHRWTGTMLVFVGINQVCYVLIYILLCNGCCVG